MADFPHTTSDLAPGMETLIKAGDTLVVTDEKGQEFAVSGRESDEVMVFLRAFDLWLSTREKRVTGLVLDGLYAEMTTAWKALPLRLQREMPSFKLLGVHVPGHDHA